MASIIKADTLQSTTANVFVLNSSGTEYARFDSTGVFQLANPTTFPAGTESLPSITATGDTNTGLYFPTADTIAFSEGGAEAMRIDSGGSVGIGITSPSTYGRFASTTPTSGYGVVSVRDSVAGGAGAQLAVYYGTFKYNYIDACVENGTAGSEQSRLMFATTTGGTLSERMRINSNGDLRLGSLAISQGNADAKSTIYGGTTDSSPCIELFKGSATTSTAQVFMRFQTGQAGTPAGNGSITSNGGASVGFTAWSDRRLKENIVDLPSQLDKIMALRPVEFDYIGMVNGHQLGFIAQEVQEIYPDLVGEGADGMLTLTDMNKNDARLIKAIQELKAIVDAQSTTITSLTARIAALEAK